MSTNSIRPSIQGGDDESSEIEESSVLGGEGDASDEVISDTDVEALVAEAPLEEQQREEAAKVVKLLPAHAVPGTNIVRRVGRPRKVERKPDKTDLDYHALMTKERDDFIEKNTIVQAIQKQTDSADMLRLVKEKVAREAAALEWQRNENQKYGRDTAQVSTRCVDALKKIADIELEIKKMGADTINLKGEKFQRVFKYLITCFQNVCSETGLLTPEQIDVLFSRLATEMEGWEERAAEITK